LGSLWNSVKAILGVFFKHNLMHKEKVVGHDMPTNKEVAPINNIAISTLDVLLSHPCRATHIR
jgi:hypothetical protein